MPHAISMFSIWENLTNTMHYCLTTVCAEGQTRWCTNGFLQSLNKPNLVFICFKINDTYCYWVHPVVSINCTSYAQLAPELSTQECAIDCQIWPTTSKEAINIWFQGKKNNILNLILLLMVWWSITTNEPGHVPSIWAFESVHVISKLLFHGPYSLSKARFLPCQTLL
jgi:hypothetical protein